MAFEPIGDVAARIVESVRRRHKAVEELKKRAMDNREEIPSPAAPQPVSEQRKGADVLRAKG